MKDLKFRNFEIHSKGATDLLAVNRESLGANQIERVFFLISSGIDQRGGHAHKACTQWFSLLSGRADLLLMNGSSTETFALESIGQVIEIPPGIWVEIKILQPSIIAVFADEDYDESDYIRDWQIFSNFKDAQ